MTVLCLGSVRTDVTFTKPASLVLPSRSVRQYSSRNGSVLFISVNSTGDNSCRKIKYK